MAPPSQVKVRPRIIVWADYTCPFCYVGTARIEWLRDSFDASIDLRTFNLHPEYPLDGADRAEVLGGKVEREDEARLVRKAGLDYRPPRTVPNTQLALELTEVARAEGVLDRLYPLVYAAYWSNGLDIGDLHVLLGIAKQAGMSPGVAAEAMADHRFTGLVNASTQAAMSIGVDGVPAWILDGKTLVPGAQPEEVFERALSDLGHEPVRPSSACG